MRTRCLKRYLFVSFVGVAFSLYAQNAAPISEVILAADGPGDTANLINQTLGGGSKAIELPGRYVNGTCTDNYNVEERIREVFDVDLNKNVFEFSIDTDVDNDRCSRDDRQRNEIKTFNPSPNNLKATQGEVVLYTWKFKMDAGFQPSSSFTHLFQLKPSGGTDSGLPTLTITPRTGGSSGNLELIYNPTTGNGEKDQKVVDGNNLSDFTGKWLEASCLIYVNGDSGEIAANPNFYANYPDPGRLYFQIKDFETQQVLMEYANEDIDMDRAGMTFNRPKWGIYRSLNNVTSLRDESVLFADFTIREYEASVIIDDPNFDAEPFLSTTDFQLYKNISIVNPVTNQIKINSSLDNLHFELFDLAGSKLLETNKKNIDVSNWNTGVYLLRVNRGSKNLIYKVLKK